MIVSTVKGHRNLLIKYLPAEDYICMSYWLNQENEQIYCRSAVLSSKGMESQP